MLAAAALFLLDEDAAALEIICQDTADVYIDEWKADENLNDKTRVLLATNMNVHHGIARGLFRFDIPADLDGSKIASATIYFSACSHCGGGNGGLVGFYALNEPFDEATDTWNTLAGGDWDSSVYSEAILPGENVWNQAEEGQPPDGVEGMDITTLLTKNLKKVKENGILIRFQDEHQVPTTHQNVASRESQDPFDFSPYIIITTKSGLWSGATDLGDGLTYLEWFGYLWVDETSPWIYHTDHGWAYAYGEDTSSIWFYTFDMGWIWTSDSVYPWIYILDGASWDVWD